MRGSTDRGTTTSPADVEPVPEGQVPDAERAPGGGSPLAERAGAMRAALRTRYGPVEHVQVATTAVPTPGPEEVLVRVAAAGLDRGVWHLATGLPYLVRLAGYGLRRPRQPVLGMDLAGQVVAVGSEVTRLRVGDEVFGLGSGAYAEFAVARADKLVHRPAELDVQSAAAIGVSGLAALQAVRDIAAVQTGQRVLVLGASGGVGSFAVQLAVAAGAVVTGVCSGPKADLVRSLGAQRVIDYTAADPTNGDERFDVILDIGGRTGIARLRRALAPRGTLVIVGGEGGGRWTGGVGRQMRAMALSPLLRQRLTTFISAERLEDLRELREATRRGALRPVVGARYQLEDVPQALLDLQAGRLSGKAVIQVAPVR